MGPRQKLTAKPTKPLALVALCLACCLLASQSKLLPVQADDDDDTKQISDFSFALPDPFKQASQGEQENFYKISSTQSISASHGLEQKLNVEEYFSLGQGLTYSLHRDLAAKDRSWALLGDGKKALWYILRNPDETDERKLDCELDHVHSHRQVFPWQFVYQIPPASGSIPNTDKSSQAANPFADILPRTSSGPNDKGNSKKRKKKSKKAFIYGVGAIWLNMIKNDVKSKLVGDNSPYPESNSWTFEADGGLEVELLFDKQDQAAHSYSDPVHIQLELDRLPLSGVRIKRRHLIESHTGSSLDGTSSGANHTEVIVVKEFKAGLTPESSGGLLDKFKAQLESCRRANKKQRLFPSLIRSLSTSAQRLYRLEYITQKFNLFRDGKQDGNYDERHHRYLWPREMTYEFLSLSNEAQTIMYDPLNLGRMESDMARSRTDVFMARFTELASGQRSSRHATAYWHIFIGNDDQEALTCKVGEHEPTPKYHLFSHPLNFHTPAGLVFRGHIRGLGALLMNAADMHYKSFTLMNREIEVSQDPDNLMARRTVEVEEWQVLDKRLGWTIHFLFGRRDPAKEPPSWDLTDRARGDLKRLVRVDIREANKDAATQEDVIAVQRDDTDDLVIRFTIVDLQFEVPSWRLNYYLEVPAICHAPDGQAGEDKDLSDDESEHGSSTYEDPDYYEHIMHGDSDSDTEDGGEDGAKNQQEGEEFEFEPGHMGEYFPLPDFFEVLGDSASFKFTTRVELVEGDEGDHDDHDDASQKAHDGHQRRKSIWLREFVDLEHEKLSLGIYISADDLARDQPEQQYLIFYESELMFKVINNRCWRVQEADTKWLRLLSAPMTYYSVAPIAGHKVDQTNVLDNEIVLESNKFSMLGVGALWRRAAESGQAEYLGSKRELVEREEGAKKYKQLVWAYEEFDMVMYFNFLLEQKPAGGEEAHENLHSNGLPSDRMHLDSIRVSGQYGDYFSGNFKEVELVVEHFEPFHYEVFLVPDICHDAYNEAQHMMEHEDIEIKPPSYEQLLGAKSPAYELEYTIERSTYSGRELEPMGNTAPNEMRVHESFDMLENRGKIVVDYLDQPVEIYIDGQAKRMYAFSPTLNKCTVLTSLKPVFQSMLGVLVFENENFDPKRLYGLAGLWSALAKRHAKMRVKRELDLLGKEHETHSYAMEVSHVPEDGVGEQWVEVVMAFVKDQPMVDERNFDKTSKLNTKVQAELELKAIEFAPLYKHLKKPPRERTKTNIFITNQLPQLVESWRLPENCASLVNKPDEGNQAGDQDKNGQPQPQPQPQPTGGDKLDQSTSLKFPKLSNLLVRLNEFHMRSEILIQGSGLYKLYILDELYHNEHLRVRSRGLGKSAKSNFDFLVYKDSREQFDLSKPFQCLANHYPKNALGLDLESQDRGQPNFMQVWSDESSLIDDLSKLYYGPLALWRMAEKPSARVKLIKTIALAPDNKPDETSAAFRERLEREMDREVWQVASPADSSGRQWSYLMEFVRLSQANAGGQDLEWHALRGISVDENYSLGEGAHPSFKIQVDVVNYNYEPNADDVIELFRLPEGWNCRRDAAQTADLFRTVHDLNLELNSNLFLTYEASLELVNPQPYDVESDDGSLKLAPSFPKLERVPTPTLTGVFMNSDLHEISPKSEASLYPHFWRKQYNNIDLSVHRSTTRFPDGRAAIRRVVVDKQRALAYEIDEQTGACSSQRGQQSCWQLEFQLANSSQTVNLFGSLPGSRELLKQLFVDTVGEEALLFSPLNKYTQGGRLVETSYEREFDSIQLTDTLKGPARVVRKFDHVMGASPFNSSMMSAKQKVLSLAGEKRRVQLHDMVSSRLFLFNQEKTQVRAILDMSLRVLESGRVGQFLAATSVADCYEAAAFASADTATVAAPSVGHFSVEFPMRDPTMQLMASFYLEAIGDHFYVNLLRYSQLMPLQLDGRAQVELAQRDNLLRVNFRVLEAPTAWTHYKERHHCAMSDQTEAASEARVASSLEGCSRWCDQLNCVAMSYCLDHTCRVVTSRALFGRASSVPPRARQLELLGQCREEGSCTYYFSELGSKTRTLSSFRAMMERVINYKSDRELLKAFGVNFGVYTAVEPSRFEALAVRELAGLEDEEQLPFELAEVLQRPASYSLWQAGRLFDTAKLEEFNRSITKPGESIFTTVHSEAFNRAECLLACTRSDCLLVAYCKDSRECQTIAPTVKSTAPLALRELRSRTTIAGSSTCSISIRDQLEAFARFEDTQAPSEFKQQLDDFSALECAAACRAQQEACLSFDFCTFKDTAADGPLSRANDGAGLTSTSANWRPATVCFLQKHHAAQDEFDQAALLPASEMGQPSARVNNRSATCEHYSKSVLLEFRRLANRKLRTAAASALRGISADKCAADCLHDDQCRAFEHCQSPRRLPTQTCYLIRSDNAELFEVGQKAELEAEAQDGGAQNAASGHLVEELLKRSAALNQLLEESRSCSIYVAKTAVSRERLEQTLPANLGGGSGQLVGAASSSHGFLMAIVYLLLATLVGATLQFVYIRLTGRDLLMR